MHVHVSHSFIISFLLMWYILFFKVSSSWILMPAFWESDVLTISYVIIMFTNFAFMVRKYDSYFPVSGIKQHDKSNLSKIMLAYVWFQRARWPYQWERHGSKGQKLRDCISTELREKRKQSSPRGVFPPKRLHILKVS